LHTLCNALTRSGAPSHRIGVTTGNADSWDSKFAKHFDGKNLVVMPDADEAGKRYQDAITAPLDAQGIPSRIVSFTDVGVKDLTDFLAWYPGKRLGEKNRDRLG
jgi:hypothetical protein